MFENYLNCRACSQIGETQGHIFNQCHKAHITQNKNKITPEDNFEEDPKIHSNNQRNIFQDDYFLTTRNQPIKLTVSYLHNVQPSLPSSTECRLSDL